MWCNLRSVICACALVKVGLSGSEMGDGLFEWSRWKMELGQPLKFFLLFLILAFN